MLDWNLVPFLDLKNCFHWHKTGSAFLLPGVFLASLTTHSAYADVLAKNKVTWSGTKSGPAEPQPRPLCTIALINPGKIIFSEDRLSISSQTESEYVSQSDAHFTVSTNSLSTNFGMKIALSKPIIKHNDENVSADFLLLEKKILTFDASPILNGDIQPVFSNGRNFNDSDTIYINPGDKTVKFAARIRASLRKSSAWYIENKSMPYGRYEAESTITCEAATSPGLPDAVRKFIQ